MLEPFSTHFCESPEEEKVATTRWYEKRETTDDFVRTVEGKNLRVRNPLDLGRGGVLKPHCTNQMVVYTHMNNFRQQPCLQDTSWKNTTAPNLRGHLG